MAQHLLRRFTIIPFDLFFQPPGQRTDFMPTGKFGWLHRAHFSILVFIFGHEQFRFISEDTATCIAELVGQISGIQWLANKFSEGATAHWEMRSVFAYHLPPP